MFANTSILRDKIRSNQPTCVVLTDDGIFWPLTRYFRRRNFSLSSEIGYATAVARAINWTQARSRSAELTADNRADAFGQFLHELSSGTIAEGSDPSGLWWSPASPKNAALTGSRVAEFGDWLAATGEGAPINPADRKASSAEAGRLLNAFAKAKSGSLLAHAKSMSRARDSSKLTRQIAAPQKPLVTLPEVAAFPIERVQALLFEGFEYERRKADSRLWMRYNLRDMLITLICLYGGTRMSEALHLWVDDIYESPANPASCKLLIHAPSAGLVDFVDPVTRQWASTNRRDYLAQYCGGKLPLTLETGRRRAGWKGCLLTNRQRSAFEVFWIDPKAGELFRELWELYLTKRRPPQKRTPWAFLTKDGQPMGTAAYSDSLRAAVKKIGLASGKWNGTTPHGLRHRYGQWLNELSVDEKSGQVAMHHVHPDSQQVYRQVTSAQVAAELALKTAAAPLITLRALGGPDER